MHQCWFGQVFLVFLARSTHNHGAAEPCEAERNHLACPVKHRSAQQCWTCRRESGAIAASQPRRKYSPRAERSDWGRSFSSVKMDWQGQKLSEQLMQYLLLGSACCAFLTGFYTSSYRMMLTIYLIGVVITFLFTVPEWSYFNRHPLEWSYPCTDWPSHRQMRLRQQKQQQAEKNLLKAASNR